MGDSPSTGPTPRHQNRLLVGSFFALLVLTGVAFTVTGTGYFAAEKAKGDLVVGTVTDYRLDESTDPAEIIVDVEVENPTMRPVKIDSANVDAIVDGTSVARASTSVDETIPADESKTITLRMTPRDDHRSVAIEAAESGSLSVSGTMWARIEQFRFRFDVLAGDSSTGGEDA